MEEQRRKKEKGRKKKKRSVVVAVYLGSSDSIEAEVAAAKRCHHSGEEAVPLQHRSGKVASYVRSGPVFVNHNFLSFLMLK